IHDPEESDDPESALTMAAPALARLRAEGVIGAYGVGSKQWQILHRFVTEAEVDAIMLAGRYTLLEQPALDELLPACEKHGEALAPVRRAYTVDDLWEVTDGRVAHTVLVQTISDVTETQSFLATASTNDGLIRGVVGWVDLAAPDVADRIVRLQAGPGGGK